MLISFVSAAITAFVSFLDFAPGGGGGLPYETDGDARRLA